MMSARTARKLVQALAICLAACGSFADAQAAQEASGNRAFRRSDYERSVDRYRKAIERGRDTPQTHYNLGTALLRQDLPAEARAELSRALDAQDPELRLSAFFNIGNSLAADEAEEPTLAELRQAAEAYKRALLLDPARTDAKWNLELTLRRIEEEQDQPQPQSGEGDSNPPPRGGGDAPSPPAPGPGGAIPPPARVPPMPGGDIDDPLPQELAEQILRAVEERERDLQRRKMRQPRSRARGPDW